MEPCAGGKFVENCLLGAVIVGVVVMQQLLYLFARCAVEGQMADILFEQHLHLFGKVGKVEPNQLAVFVLPLVAVGLDAVAMMQETIEMGHLVNQHQ